MSRQLTIENKSWTVENLLTNITSIKKPKFQRKKKWLVQPSKKGNKANSRDFIDFLRRNQNTVHPISFGEEIKNDKKTFVNIDGNNRINAICDYIKTPFTIYPEYMEELSIHIRNIVDLEEASASQLITFFKELNYTKISGYKKIKHLYECKPEIAAIFSKINMENTNKIDEALERIQKEMLLPSGDSFEKEVKLNINLFQNANYFELCKMFEDINKYSSNLSESELLASTLYNHLVKIDDENLNFEIRKEIKIYYDEKNENEVLQGFQIDDINTFELNVFDCIVGLQNHCSKKFKNVIMPFDTDGISLFFKMYKLLYGELNTSFTSENINLFIKTTMDACEILFASVEELFPKNVDEALFNKKVHRDEFDLKKNTLVLVLSAIIGFSRNETPLSKIKQNIQKIILYHLFVKEIKSKEMKEDYKRYDTIKYEAGGTVIEATGIRLLKNPELISDDITIGRMSEIIAVIIRETNNIPSKKTRRKLNLVERCLTSAYYNVNVSTSYLTQNYSVEHIIPFSSTCDSSIDELVDVNLDRVGNMIPVIDKMNKGRGNRHIEYYKIHDNTFVSFLKNIPSVEVYDVIIDHKKTNKPIIIDVGAYNDLCEKNEKTYVDNFTQYLFSK